MSHLLTQFEGQVSCHWEDKLPSGCFDSRVLWIFNNVSKWPLLWCELAITHKSRPRPPAPDMILRMSRAICTDQCSYDASILLSIIDQAISFLETKMNRFIDDSFWIKHFNTVWIWQSTAPSVSYNFQFQKWHSKMLSTQFKGSRFLILKITVLEIINVVSGIYIYNNLHACMHPV